MEGGEPIHFKGTGSAFRISSNQQIFTEKDFVISKDINMKETLKKKLDADFKKYSSTIF